MAELETTTSNIVSDAAQTAQSAADSVQGAAASVQQEAESWEKPEDFPDPVASLKEEAADKLKKGADIVSPKKSVSKTVQDAAKPAVDALKQFVASARSELENPVVAANVGVWSAVAVVAASAAVYASGKSKPLPAAFYGPHAQAITAGLASLGVALIGADVFVSVRNY